MVALLAEGVDRNTWTREAKRAALTSPSSRRAWIEIEKHPGSSGQTLVALLAEGVDRNRAVSGHVRMMMSRPPRGGRG